MTETIITLFALILGFIAGWILKGKTSAGENAEGMERELENLREQLIQSQRKEASAVTRVEEMGKRFQEEKERLKQIREDMENTFKALAGDAIKSNSEEFIKLANEKFKSVLDTTENKLDEKKKLIDQNLNEIHKTLMGLTEQSTQLNTRLQESRMETEKLRETATNLREVLSSSQKRGQWGERMVEDILQFVGLIENINYRKQSMVETGEKPDYTFILPKDKVLNMDVKFPLAHYERYVQSESDEGRDKEKVQFFRDVRQHIKSISNRAYINPAEGTLDYVMMFIPNESIYGFINREDPDLVDFALGKKVLLCSPLTLYAILSLIHQATRNFAMEERAAEVMNLVDAFRKQWEKYTDVMDKMGKSLEQAQNHFNALVSTRTRQLEKPLRRIDELSGSFQPTLPGKGDSVAEEDY